MASDRSPDGAVLSVRDLVVRFGGLVAVDEVSLDVQRGELRAVIGPNGAGKTTLFNAIGGTVTPTAGSITLDGEDVTVTSPHRMARRGLSRAFQTPSIFPELTVRENVWLGAKKGAGWNALSSARREIRSDERVEALASDVGIADHLDATAGNLSHADQKLLDIAIALATEPRVLLLDEPTQGVSPDEVARLEEVAVKSLERVECVLMIEHNVGTVLEVAHVITVLERGQVIAEGDPDEISRNEEVQDVYLGRA